MGCIRTLMFIAMLLTPIVLFVMYFGWLIALLLILFACWFVAKSLQAASEKIDAIVEEECEEEDRSVR